jgi:hypothetical protein
MVGGVATRPRGLSARSSRRGPARRTHARRTHARRSHARRSHARRLRASSPLARASQVLTPQGEPLCSVHNGGVRGRIGLLRGIVVDPIRQALYVVDEGRGVVHQLDYRCKPSPRGPSTFRRLPSPSLAFPRLPSPSLPSLHLPSTFHRPSFPRLPSPSLAFPRIFSPSLTFPHLPSLPSPSLTFPHLPSPSLRCKPSPGGPSAALAALQERAQLNVRASDARRRKRKRES